MNNRPGEKNDGAIEELRELVELELQDILATAKDEGYERQDVLDALDCALQAERAGKGEAPAQLVEADIAGSS